MIKWRPDIQWQRTCHKDKRTSFM